MASASLVARLFLTDLTRHARTLRTISPFHRLFQMSLGVIACQHPAVLEAVGRPVSWQGLYRAGGGIGLLGPKGSYAVVPTLKGAWTMGRMGQDVVRAVDQIVDAMAHTADNVLPSAKRGREGNTLARGWYYLQRELTEPEFVDQYITFVQSPQKPEPLQEIFGRVGD